MLYLVSGTVSKSHYMDDTPDVSTELRIVEADSDYYAEEKFKKHFNDMTEEYAVYYSVSQIDSSEMIR